MRPSPPFRFSWRERPCVSTQCSRTGCWNGAAISTRGRKASRHARGQTRGIKTQPQPSPLSLRLHHHSTTIPGFANNTLWPLYIKWRVWRVNGLLYCVKSINQIISSRNAKGKEPTHPFSLEINLSNAGNFRKTFPGFRAKLDKKS